MTARNPWRSERVAASVTHVLSVVVLLVASMGAASAQRPALVGVAKAEVQEVTENRPIIGQLVASVEADVAARIPGIVTEVSFEIGDRVLKDQVLARLDSELIAIERSTAEADVDVAEAGLAVAEAEVKRADVAFKRQAALRQSGAFSRSRFEDLQQELNKARAELSRARAQLLRSKAALALFTYRVTHSEIKAPFDGVVIARRSQPGAYIQRGAAVATLLDIANLEIEADVPVELVAGLSIGREVDATFEGGETIKAMVRAVVPVQTISTRTRPVRFRLDLAQMGATPLARGKSVTLMIPASAPRKTLTIPKDALVQNTTGWLVYTVVEGKAQPRRVEIGDAAGSNIEITSGLNEGDVVVIRGNERLRPGQPVKAAGIDTSKRS
jgi:RND family efflux transporter MFP subunit